jgi:hypothetical protein
MSDAKKIVSEVSAEDIDKLVRIGSFTHELEEVCCNSSAVLNDID